MPVLGALVNIECNASLVKEYYGWTDNWPDGFDEAVIHFMQIWRQMALKKGIKVNQESEIAFALEGVELLEKLDHLFEMKDNGLCAIQPVSRLKELSQAVSGN